MTDNLRISNKYSALVQKPAPLTAVERTRQAMRDAWENDNGRKNQAARFIKKALKSDKKRKMEKVSRKRNRK